MRNRLPATAAAVLAVALLASCTPRPHTQLSGTASVSIDGNGADFHIVKCSQVEWIRMIDIGSDFAGATVQVDERREPVTVSSVRIQNVADFTGTYSQGDGSDAATTSLNSGQFTITGTAHGSKTDKPTEPATANFKIIVAC